MSISEYKILKNRSLEFLKYAEIQLNEGHYALSCFSSEQAVQLYLKSKILKISGEIPRTHSIRELLGILARLTSREEYVNEFIKKKRAEIRMMESAYIESRYIPKEFEEDDARLLFSLAKEVIKFVDSISPD